MRPAHLQKKRYRDLQDVRHLLQSASADAVRALLVFLDLLEGKAERLSQLLLAHRKIFRRMRTRLPTCLSTGLGAFLGAASFLEDDPRCLPMRRIRSPCCARAAKGPRTLLRRPG